MVRHWVEVMLESAYKQSGHGQEVRHQNSLFYFDDGKFVSSEPRWIQGAFSALVGMFDGMGLKTNLRKTFGIVFRPCQVAETWSEAVYG